MMSQFSEWKISSFLQKCSYKSIMILFTWSILWTSISINNIHSLPRPPPTRYGFSLYTYEDPVNILYTSNISQFIYDKHQDGQKVQLVQFYNTYCGHCQAFSPLFLHFLWTTRSWTEFIDFSVVDCEDFRNLGACRSFQIVAYPTIIKFWLKPSKGDKGEIFHPSVEGGWQTPEDLRRDLIKWFTDSSKADPSALPERWPKLAPLNPKSPQDLVDQFDLDNENRTIVLVVENVDSYFGRELMLNFSRHYNEIVIYRIEDSSARVLDQIVPDVLDKYHVPFLFTISRKERNFKIIAKAAESSETDDQFYDKAIRKIMVNQTDDNVDHDLDDHQNKTILKYSSRVYANDLYNSLRLILFHDIITRKYLNIEETTAAISFLKVVYDNFPFTNERHKKFIESVYHWLQTQLNGAQRSSPRLKANSRLFDSDELIKQLEIYKEIYQFPGSELPWRACVDVGRYIRRSFTCSVWTMFHVMTMTEYRRSIQTGKFDSLHKTLYAMKAYIKNFFICSDCQHHFSEMAKTLEEELTYTNSSVLWIWRSHNKVNARLKGTPTDHRRLPKRQFPTYEECSYCYKREPPRNATIYKDYGTYLQYYNQEKVLQFLVNFYSSERIIHDDDHSNVVSSTIATPTNSARKPRSKLFLLVSSPFTQTDISLMFLFYVASIMLLVSIYSYIRMRRSIFHQVFNIQQQKQRIY